MKITFSGKMSGVVLALTGAALFLWHQWLLGESAEMKKWPEAQAMIMTLNVERKHQVVTGANDTHWRYFPVVTYRYSVDGREYTGSRIRPGTDSASRYESDARQIINGYSYLQKVKIRHRPGKPEDSYLSIDPPWWTPYMPFAAGGLVILGILFFIIGVFHPAKTEVGEA
jgi:hypothetical protein